MKRLMIILASVFLFTIQCKSTNIPLDSIKASMFVFLEDVEHCKGIDEMPNALIIDRKKGGNQGGQRRNLPFSSINLWCSFSLFVSRKE